MKPWKLITNGVKIHTQCVCDNFLMFLLFFFFGFLHGFFWDTSHFLGGLCFLFHMALLGSKGLFWVFLASLSSHSPHANIRDSCIHTSALDPIGTQILYLLRPEIQWSLKSFANFTAWTLFPWLLCYPCSSGLSFPLTEKRSPKNEWNRFSRRMRASFIPSVAYDGFFGFPFSSSSILSSCFKF